MPVNAMLAQREQVTAIIDDLYSLLREPAFGFFLVSVLAPNQCVAVPFKEKTEEAPSSDVDRRSAGDSERLQGVLR